MNAEDNIFQQNRFLLTDDKPHMDTIRFRLSRGLNDVASKDHS